MESGVPQEIILFKDYTVEGWFRRGKIFNFEDDTTSYATGKRLRLMFDNQEEDAGGILNSEKSTIDDLECKGRTDGRNQG